MTKPHAILRSETTDRRPMHGFYGAKKFHFSRRSKALLYVYARGLFINFSQSLPFRRRLLFVPKKSCLVLHETCIKNSCPPHAFYFPFSPSIPLSLSLLLLPSLPNQCDIHFPLLLNRKSEKAPPSVFPSSSSPPPTLSPPPFNSPPFATLPFPVRSVTIIGKLA